MEIIIIFITDQKYIFPLALFYNVLKISDVKQALASRPWAFSSQAASGTIRYFAL